MYAGHDGSVYRNQGGSWQKYDNGGWNSVDRSGADRPVGTSGTFGNAARDGASSGLSSTTRDQLNRDYAARAEGAQRTRDVDRMRSGSFSSSRAGSYRPSGGGFRGGGGGGGFRGGGGRRR
jgi:hypothetical protein